MRRLIRIIRSVALVLITAAVVLAAVMVAADRSHTGRTRAR
jgi:hypothetical protein